MWFNDVAQVVVLSLLGTFLHSLRAYKKPFGVVQWLHCTTPKGFLCLVFQDLSFCMRLSHLARFLMAEFAREFEVGAGQ